MNFPTSSYIRLVSAICVIMLFVSCSSDTPEDLSKRVNQLISEDDYSQALTLINGADSSETQADLMKLKEKTHLNYGMYLEYRGPEDQTMRDRMTTALEQYIAVLRINPKNQKARKEIRQIMSIYNTMPDKSPGEEILNNLRELGFEY